MIVSFFLICITSSVNQTVLYKLHENTTPKTPKGNEIHVDTAISYLASQRIF